MRKAPRAITLNCGVFQDVATYRLRGFSPLAGDFVGHFHGDLHDAVTVARRREFWQDTVNAGNLNRLNTLLTIVLPAAAAGARHARSPSHTGSACRS